MIAGDDQTVDSDVIRQRFEQIGQDKQWIEYDEMGHFSLAEGDYLREMIDDMVRFMQ